MTNGYKVGVFDYINGLAQKSFSNILFEGDNTVIER